MTQLNAELHADESSSCPSLTDEQLAVRAQEGSSACFGILVERFENRLLTFLIKRLGDPHAAQDIAQDAFVRAWEYRNRYNPKWRFSTWLYTIASRQASNHLRSKTLRITQPLDANDASNDSRHASQPITQSESHSLVWQLAADHLSATQQSILWLRYGQDLPCKDIARVLGTTSVAVRASLHRARKTLREQLNKLEAPHKHQHPPTQQNAESFPIHQHRTLQPERVT